MKRRKRICGIIFAIVVVLLMLLRLYHQTAGHPEEGQHAVTCVENEADATTGKALHQERAETFAGHPSPLSQEVHTALKHGAKAKVTLKVVDSTGKKVPGAYVHVHFTFFNRKQNDVEGITDSDGFFVAEKESTLAYRWAVQKEGYYATIGKQYLAAKSFNASVKAGRWQPWNPTITVVLKEKRNPIYMVTKRIDVKLPKDTQAQFDCLIGDWLPPLGQGKAADMSFMYRSDFDGSLRYLTNSLIVAMDQGGLVKLKQDEFSELKSIYEAPDIQYEKEIGFEFSRTSDKIFTDVTLPPNEYLVFYSDVSRDGETDSIYFGKLTALEYGESKNQGHWSLRFTYYVNPTPNDRTLEAQGQYP